MSLCSSYNNRSKHFNVLPNYIFKTNFTLQHRLTLNSQKYSEPSLPHAGITGLSHHTQIFTMILRNKLKHVQNKNTMQVTCYF